MRTTGRRLWAMLVLAVAVASTAGCTDEEVVFRERPLFDDPPTAAGSFLGYSDQDEKLSVCGNCHVGSQSGWETTGHAGAWEGLQASGSSQTFCEGCHTVNERGNPVEAEAGWTATGDERYHDVQCEACHGPGESHVGNPEASQPLANLSIKQVGGLDAETGCAECHQGTHHPFVDQWLASAHGNVTSFAAGRAGCNSCHEGKAALSAQFNEDADYVEKGDGEITQITCAVCHDPHGTQFAADLRAPLDEPSRENLCVTCHSRQGTPNTGSPNEHGPHAYQGLLVLGEDAGWIPPGSDLSGVGEIVSTHGSEANPRLCATCHVAQREITDAETGEFLIQSVGHTFEAIPCLDEQGVPREDCTLQERSFQACTAADGCHGSEAAARSAFVTVRNRINNLLDELWADSDGDAVLETSDGGLLPQVMAQQGRSEVDVLDSTFTIAEGAIWNAQLSHTDTRPHWGSAAYPNGDHFGAHKGSGDGVHNPFLIEALLTASINAVENEYGVSASIGTDIRATTPPAGVSLR